MSGPPENTSSALRFGVVAPLALVLALLAIDKELFGHVVPWVLVPLAVILGLTTSGASLLRGLPIAALALVALAWFDGKARATAVGAALLLGSLIGQAVRRGVYSTQRQQSLFASLVARVTQPAVALLDDVPYIAKVAVIWLLILIPLGSVTKLQYEIANERVVFNGREMLGVDYAEPVRELLFAVQRHRVLDGAVRAGDERARRARDVAGADAERAIAAVDAVDARLSSPVTMPYGPPFNTTARWRDAKAEWAHVARGDATSPETSDAAHAACSRTLMVLLLDVANQSNLILDPDLDSYWLMDAFVQKLPRLTDAVARSATLALQKRTDERGQRQQLVDLAGLYREQTALLSDLVNVNMTTAFAEAANFSKRSTVSSLNGPVDTARAAVTNVAEDLRREQLSGAHDVDPGQRDTTRLAVDALAAAHDLWHLVGPELRGMCERRVTKYVQQRTTGLVTTLVGTALLAYVLLGVYASIRRAVTDLGSAAGRMVAGHASGIVVSSHDEVADIAESFNKINEALVDARELRREREEIAQELHDEILQRLYAIGLELEVAKADSQDAPVQSRIDECTSRLNEVIRGVRSVILGAESGFVDSARLQKTLRSFAAQIADRGRLEVEFDLDETLLRSVSKDRAKTLAFVARETMLESKDLAQAGRARLSLRRADGCVVLEWEDDGERVPEAAKRKARVAELGGVYEQSTRTGGGNRIVCRFPDEAGHV